MSSRMRNLAAAAAAQLPTLLVLAGLVSLAVWGAANEWKGLPFMKAAEKKEEDKEAPIEASARFVPAEAPPVSWILANWLRPQLTFPSDEAVTRAGIETAVARAENVSASVSAPGSVDFDPKLYARLTSRAAGTIFEVHKEIGDPVHKGEILALVESADVGKYKADFLQYLAQRKLRQANLELLKHSSETGGIPPRSLLEAEAALRAAQIGLYNAQQALLNLGLSLRLEDVETLPEDRQAEYMRDLGLGGPWWYGGGLPSERETLTANLLPLKAPFDGVVVQRNVARGESVQANQGRSLFVVADVHHLHVDLDVNPADALRVRLGQEVSFKLAGQDRKVSARVSHISPEVDEKTRRVRIHAEVDTYAGTLRPNTFGTGRIFIGRPHRAVLVPAAAVQSDRDDSFVFVQLSDRTFEMRLVTPGLSHGGLVEVKGDVREGEKVVTSGSFALKSELYKDRIAGGD